MGEEDDLDNLREKAEAIAKKHKLEEEHRKKTEKYRRKLKEIEEAPKRKAQELENARWKRIDNIRRLKTLFKDGMRNHVNYGYHDEIGSWKRGKARTILTAKDREDLALKIDMYSPCYNFSDEDYFSLIKEAAEVYQLTGRGNIPFVRKRLLAIASKLVEEEHPYAVDYVKWAQKFLRKNPEHKTSFLKRVYTRLFGSESEKKELYDLNYDPLKEVKERLSKDYGRHEKPGEFEEFLEYDPLGKGSQHQQTKGKSIERKVAGTTSVILIVIGILLLSPVLTGNVIGNSSTTNSTIGIALLIVGLVVGVFWMRGK